MNETVSNAHLVLASKSPRRRYLLAQAGIRVRVDPSTLDESRLPLSEPPAYVRRLAEAKAAEVAERHFGQWVLGADTIVLIDDTILGKPRSAGDARDMLQRLSGTTHRVLTGYCIVNRCAGHHFSASVRTEVRFKTLTEREISWYIRTGEPFDKAGAYAIQGIGTFLVRSIRGSYTNVVGLPVCEVIEHLLEAGVVGLETDAPNRLDAKELR